MSESNESNEPAPVAPIRERCATCAYRAGTEASRSKSTLLTAKLCALAAEPFYCHEERLAPGADDSVRTVVCAGHTAAVLALGDVPDWQRALAVSMLTLMEEVDERPADFDTDRKCVTAIRRMIGLD